MAVRKKKVQPVEAPTRYEIETFRSIGNWEIGNLKMDAPSCHNSVVRIRKWRVTAELIDEPAEVLAERLRKLWREGDNFHHYDPMMRAAAKLGITLSPHDFGKDRQGKGKCGKISTPKQPFGK